MHDMLARELLNNLVYKISRTVTGHKIFLANRAPLGSRFQFHIRYHFPIFELELICFAIEFVDLLVLRDFLNIADFCTIALSSISCSSWSSKF